MSDRARPPWPDPDPGPGPFASLALATLLVGLAFGVALALFRRWGLLP